MASIVLLHRSYGPYHVARAAALDRRLPGRMKFVQLAARETAREWRATGPSPEILTAVDGAFEELPPRRIVSGLLELLDKLRPSAVVIAGYADPAMRAAAQWARRNSAASILLSDSHHVDRPRHRIKELAKRVWVSRRFDATFVAGATSAAYARSLGFATSQIWRGYDVVDNAFFAAGADAVRRNGSSLLRDLGLPERAFVYVGRFNAEKNLQGLLDAMGEYRRRAGAGAWGLLLVGSGPEAQVLERRARSMHGSVAMLGFQQIDELAKVYGACSALVLPSTSEPWGLVVNEAMACGLPVLASDRVGAMYDLVFPGINGYLFDPDDREDLVRAMLRLSSGGVDLAAMGRASVRIVGNFTLETWADALADCIEVTLQSRRS